MHIGILNLSRIATLIEDITKKGFFHLVSANLIIGFMGFGSQLLVVKFLTPEELGQIKALQAFVAFAAVLAGCGFNTSVLKLCSEKRSVEEKAYIFRQNLLFSIIPTLVILCLLFLSAKLQVLSPDRTVNKWMLYYMFVIPAGVYTSLVIVYLQSLKKIQLMAKAQIFIRILSFIGLVCLTYLVGMNGYIIASILVGYIALIPLVNIVKGSLGVKGRINTVFRESVYYAKWSLAANAAGVIGTYGDIYLLNYLTKDRVEFGYYSLATIFVFAMNGVTSTVQAISAPFFSEKSADKAEFLRVLVKYEKLIVLLAFGITVLAISIVPLFISMAYGEDYAVAGLFVRILALKYFLWSCYALLGVAIFGLGRMKYNFVCSSISVPLSLILSYLLIVSYGFVGAAIAQVVANLFALLLIVVIFKHVIKIHFKGINSDRIAFRKIL
jgi:O-antigen/teichoic acid export membrane protein